MVKIAISGSNGLIGSRLIELLKTNFDFIELDLPSFDITNREQTSIRLQNLNFDIFIHLAGYTNVDGAENNKEVAHKINIEGTKNVFESVIGKGKKFIYISTDFVFDGTKQPFFEDSKPNPLSYYSKTKYEGEKIVKNNAMIIRLAYPYRAHFDLKKDFVRAIKFTLEQKKTLKMVTDSSITPTFIDDIALAMKYLLNNFSIDIFHIVGSNSLSPYDAGKLIAATFGLDQSLIQPTTFKLYSKNRALRPQWSEIETKNNDFCKMKTFEQGLNELKRQIYHI